MPIEEFNGWIHFFKKQHEENEKARASSKSGSGSMSRGTIGRKKPQRTQVTEVGNSAAGPPVKTTPPAKTGKAVLFEGRVGKG